MANNDWLQMLLYGPSTMPPGMETPYGGDVPGPFLPTDQRFSGRLSPLDIPATRSMVPPGPPGAPMGPQPFSPGTPPMMPGGAPAARPMVGAQPPPNAAGPARGGSVGMPFGPGMQPMGFPPMAPRPAPIPMDAPKQPALDPRMIGMLASMMGDRDFYGPPSTPGAGQPPVARPPMPAPPAARPPQMPQASAPPPPAGVTATTGQVAGAPPAPQPTPDQIRQQQIEEWRKAAQGFGQYGMLSPYLPGLQAPTSY